MARKPKASVPVEPTEVPVEVTEDANVPEWTPIEHVEDVEAAVALIEAPATVAFVSDKNGQGIWDGENDRMLAQFVDGEYQTDDPRTIALLDAAKGVHRKEA